MEIIIWKNLIKLVGNKFLLLGGSNMKLSKYYQHIKMDDKYEAVFNSILMQIIFVEKEKIKDIEDFKLNEDETKLMIENGCL